VKEVILPPDNDKNKIIDMNYNPNNQLEGEKMYVFHHKILCKNKLFLVGK